MKQKRLKFKDGSTLIGTLVAKAAHIEIFKVKNAFYMVNKTEILEDNKDQSHGVTV